MKKEDYLNITWIEPNRGIKLVKARMAKNKGEVGNIVYPKEGDPTTEPRFRLYRSGGELRVFSPSPSLRRLRRFARDYCKSQGGAVHTTRIWIVPWK